MPERKVGRRFWVPLVLVIGTVTSLLFVTQIKHIFHFGLPHWPTPALVPSVNDTHLPASEALFPASYAVPSRISSTPGGSADVTTVILNWSRLPNVVLIVSSLCAAALGDTIAEVVVWNNSPQKLSQQVRSDSIPRT